VQLCSARSRLVIDQQHTITNTIFFNSIKINIINYRSKLDSLYCTVLARRVPELSSRVR